MNDTFNHPQIQQIKLAIKEVMEEMLDEKLQPLKQDIDKVLKIVSDTSQEQVITQSKVDDHEIRITTIESNFATTWPIASTLSSATIPFTSVNTLLLV